MKNFATALGLILTLSQASPESSETPYGEFIGKADLIVVASLEHAELNAVRDQITWTVRYHVSEVLRGNYIGESITLTFDAETFKKADSSGRGTREVAQPLLKKPLRGLLILFLRSGDDGEFDYAGPPLNSPSIIASATNIAALQQELAQPRQEQEITWFDTILPGGITSVVIVAAFVVVGLVLVVMVTKKLRRPPHSGDISF